MPGPTTALSWIITVRRGSGACWMISARTVPTILGQSPCLFMFWLRAGRLLAGGIGLFAPDPLRTLMIQLRAVVGPGISCLPFTHLAGNRSADFGISRLWIHNYLTLVPFHYYTSNYYIFFSLYSNSWTWLHCYFPYVLSGDRRACPLVGTALKSPGSECTDARSRARVMIQLWHDYWFFVWHRAAS